MGIWDLSEISSGDRETLGVSGFDELEDSLNWGLPWTIADLIFGCAFLISDTVLFSTLSPSFFKSSDLGLLSRITPLCAPVSVSLGFSLHTARTVLRAGRLMVSPLLGGHLLSGQCFELGGGRLIILLFSCSNFLEQDFALCPGSLHRR